MKEIKVAVIGSGTMGKGIVQVLSQSEVTSSIVWIVAPTRVARQHMKAYCRVGTVWLTRKDCLLKMQLFFRKSNYF